MGTASIGDEDVLNSDDQLRFEQLVLPHLNAAFNLAFWLTRSRTDAEDVVQEALLRSYRFFATFYGTNARAWLLQIVRNTCYTWLRQNRPPESMSEFNEELHSPLDPTPEALAIAGEDQVRVARGLESLSPRFRELIILRDLEGCSYKEISTIMSIPMGTVMSSLSRARRQLQSRLVKDVSEEVRR